MTASAALWSRPRLRPSRGHDQGQRHRLARPPDGQVSSADPMPRPLAMEGGRRDIFLHPDAQQGLLHDPRVDALQPPIPPAHGLAQKVHGRPGHPFVGHHVPPGPDESQPGDPQVGEKARDGVDVGVGPPPDRHDGAFDGGVVLGHRAVLPEVVLELMRYPVVGQLGSLFEPPTAICPATHRDGSEDREVGGGR